MDNKLSKLPIDKVEQNMLAKLVDDIARFDNDLESKQKLDTNKFRIHHYTSPGGLKGILENNSLWFTDYRFLNDRSEKIYTFDLFKNCMEEERKNLKSNFYNTILNCICEDGNINYDSFNKILKYSEGDYYVASFSINDNSLSLWNYYTKTVDKTGYSISFKSKELINSLSNKSFDYYKVYYKINTQKNILKGYIHQFNDVWDDNRSDVYLKWILGLLLDVIDMTSLKFKHNAFENEKEFRIVYKILDISREKIKNEKLLKFRESNGIMIPYLDISFEKNSIVGVKISPTQQDRMAKEGLFLMLKHLEYDHLSEDDITISDIPLRF